jgi:hypothetical protein
MKMGSGNDRIAADVFSPREPCVGLDRERVRAERLGADLDRIGVAVGVALGLQVALEL